ncbi:MAG: hypothetical protein D4S02_12375 [Rhodocyclaceae bacterium]|nr:MAG: hypothetical protein D4S02_12375 [Rhodocyclaceae bacterium]
MIKMTGMVLATAFIVTGCGGGDGGSASTGTTLPAVTPTTVGGTVAKGLVKQAKVLACRIVNGAPEADASCVTTTTGNDGSYSMTFGDGYTGPAMIKVMAGAVSTMVDETTGADIPYNMTMRAVVPAVGNSTTVYVTPFSEMAASAVSTTTIDATKITQSIAAVQSVMSSFGIDLSVMPMVDLKNSAANSATLTTQSNMVKQLGRVVMAATNSNLIQDAKGVPCNATGTTTSQQIACTVSAMVGVMSSYVTADLTKSANMLAALNGQNVTNLIMPILKADGTVSMVTTDVSSSVSMQSTLQNAGMPVNNAANAANIIMGGMR